jgi:hypothetical protein
MTATIIIEVAEAMTLYTLFFNIRVYALRIYTRQPKKRTMIKKIFQDYCEKEKFPNTLLIISAFLSIVYNPVNLSSAI